MFPVLKNFPLTSNAYPDTSFSNGVGTITKGVFLNKKYTAIAGGQPVHGLNIDGSVFNSKDFDPPVQYVDVKFMTPTAGTKKAWDGVSWIDIENYGITTQISGFRSGDVNVFRVPDFDATRTFSEVDDIKYLAWKDYAIISGRQRVVFGKPLKKDSWLCSFGVGRTYKIKFLGSTGSTTANRNFSFSARLYGSFGGGSRPVQVFGVSGPKDYQDNTETAILAKAIVPNLRTCEKWRVEDFTTNGQKVIISAYIPPVLSGIPNFEDDGVNDVCSAPVAWLEFTFEEDGDDLKVTYKILGNYAETASAKSIGYVTLAPLLANMSPASRYTRVGVRAAYVPAGAPPSYVSNYNPYKFTYSDYGSGFPHDIIFLEGLAVGENTGTPSTMLGEVGKYNSGSPGTRVLRTRMVHMCYDKDNSVSIASIRYLRYRHTGLKKLLSFSAFSDYFRMPKASPVVSGGSAYAEYEIETIPSYQLFEFSLQINGQTVDSMTVETKTDAYTTSGKSYIAAVGALPAPTSTNSTPETTQTVTPSINTGILSLGGALDPISGWQITEPFRDTGVSDSSPEAWIRPFVRVDSNKIVSLHVAREGYSAVFPALPSGNNLLFNLITPSLVVGNHFYKYTYDMYNTRALVNTNIAGNPANPVLNISGSNYVCSLNPATGEAVLSSASECTWV